MSMSLDSIRALARCTSLFSAALAFILIAERGASQTSKPARPAWPKLSSAESSKLKPLLKRLSSEKEGVAEAAETKIVAIGAAAAPRVIRLFAPRTSERHAVAKRILDGVVKEPHAPLLAVTLGHKHAAARRWAAGWLATHPQTGQDKAMQAALAKEKDDKTMFNLSLGLGARGHFDKLDAAFAQCRDDWRNLAPMVAKSLEPARSVEAVEWAQKKLEGGDELDKVTALRLMRSLCPKTHIIVLKSQLDDSSHAVKKAAINALRVVVDGEEPLENLSVFQAIDKAKKWKAR